MSTISAAPERQKILEGTGPVSDRIGVTPEMLREIARESGLYIQRKRTGPLLWTAELEAQIVRYITTTYRGPSAPAGDSDPFA